MPIVSAPFFKWPGGKRWVAGSILAHLPTRVSGTYYEPCLGGGAVFFALASAGRLRRAVIADINPELICAYRAVRDDSAAVLRALAWHRERDGEGHYYEVRAEEPERLRGVERGARFLYLCMTAFNGLWRENKKGRMNSPWGKRAFCPTAAAFAAYARQLEVASALLALAEIRCGDFAETLVDVRAEDAVYIDPPYLPRSRTASFTAYAARRFDTAEHLRLAQTARAAAARGATVLVSNADTPEARAIYPGAALTELSALRRIAARATSRAAVPDLLIRFGRREAEAGLRAV